MHDQSPQYLKDLMIKPAINHSLWSKPQNLLEVPHCNTRFGERAFDQLHGTKTLKQIA
jgi:hypothetical protein